jgi:hypothetical protein
MRLDDLESIPHWRATVEYHGSHGRQTVCLMESRVIVGRHFWFITDYQGECPWEAVRPYDPGATARMVEGGKMRLVNGRWPDIVSAILAQSHSSP